MSQDSLESGELLLEDGELPQEVSSGLPPVPRPQHRDDGWAGPPRRDGGWDRERAGSFRDDRDSRGPPRSSGGSALGRGPGPDRRRSPPPLPGRGSYPPARTDRGHPYGRGPPLGPPPYERGRELERGGSRPPFGPPRSPPLLPMPMARPRSGSPAPLLRPLSPPPPRAASPPPRVLTAEEEAASDAREMGHIAADVKSLCRTLTLQACLKDLERVCSDLRLALRKASAFLKLLQKRDESVKGADDSEALASLAGGLLSGLRALHVFSNTGAGRRMPAAREPVQTAWKAREELFTEVQRKQLEGFVSSSKNFKALLAERSPSPQPVRRDYVPAPRVQPQPRERKQKKAEVPSEGDEAAAGQPPALSKRQLKKLQAAQRAEAAAAEAAAAQAAQQQQAAKLQAMLEAKRKAAEEAVEASKRYKMTFKFGSSLPSSEPAAASGPDSAAPAPDAAAAAAGSQPLVAAPLSATAARAAALNGHWGWQQQQHASAAATAAPFAAAAEQHAQQQQQVQQQAAVSGVEEGLPPLPPEDGPGGWQSVAAPMPASPPLSPMSSSGSPINGLEGDGLGLGLNAEALEHAARGSPAVREVLGQGKLCLVLDLDHTLLNSATFAEVGPQVQAALEAQAAREAATLPDSQRLLFRLDAIKMWTKLRPAVREFLQRASHLFQLWIHTNGNRVYARSVVQLLDPSGTLFGDRIIAQGAERVDQMVADQEKRLMQGLSERESITVIVDDSHSVWSQHSHNLVAVERYIYFPSSRASLGLKGPSLMDTGRDEDSERGMLMVTFDVLSRVHSAVMGALRTPPVPLPGGEVLYPKWDARHALSQERKQVLAGVHLVFTRVIPLEMEPSAHALWKLAESFGAQCSGVLDDSTTHVVAGASGTEKVLAARDAGKWVVTPAWLECSCILWKRASEDRFLVPP